MAVKFRKKFLVELSKVAQPTRKEIETFVFEHFPANPSISQWQHIVPLNNNPSLFKVLFHDYRIGLQRTDQGIIFERVRHRNDIYRIQP